MKQLLILIIALSTGLINITLQAQTWNTVFKAPANGSTIYLSGDPNQPLVFSWEAAVPEGTANGGYQSTLRIIEKDSDWVYSTNFLSDNNGNDSAVTFTYENFASQFGELKSGQSRTYQWIVSTLYFDVNHPGGGIWKFLVSADTFDLVLNRGTFDNEFNLFSLITPANAFSYDVEGDINYTLNFSWDATTCPGGCAAPNYVVLIDTIENNWDYPMYSNFNAGTNTNLSLSNNNLAAVCTMANISRGTSKTLYWTVMASNGSNLSFASVPHQITLNRKYLNNENTPLYCTSPNDNTSIKLQGDTVTAFTFNWTSSKLGPTTGQYTLKMALQSGSLNNPEITQTTGLDTFWNTSFGSLMNRMDAAYGNTWDTLRLQWTVQANFSGPTFDADNIHRLTLVRGFFYANGFAENNSQQPLVYPQPANNELIISLLPAPTDWQLLDISGRSLQQGTMQSAPLSLKVDNLSPGIYLFHYQHTSQQGSIKVLIER